METKDAFAKLMGSEGNDKKHKDVIAIGVIYSRQLLYIDPLEPLYGCHYIGQSVSARFDTPLKVAEARWKHENCDSKRECRRIGLIHCLDAFGPTAFKDVVLESMRGPYDEVQAWADARERALIKEHGGPLKDPSMKCKQTLNLTKGGKGALQFESNVALRTLAWNKFQNELQSYVECYGTALVPLKYVASSNYRLGEQVMRVRQGALWKGHPQEAERVEWLESLPGWAWKALDTAEYRKTLSEQTKARWDNASKEKRAEWSRNSSEAQLKPEVRQAQSERKKEWWQSLSEQERAELSKKNSTARLRPDAREAQSKRAKTMWSNASDEKRAEWLGRISEAQLKPEIREKKSKSAKAQAEREAAEGKPSLAERGRATSTANWSHEQRQAALDKQKATKAMKRAEVLKGLTGRALVKKQKEYANTDKKGAVRLAKANAIMQIPKFAANGHRWCYKKQSEAQKQGAVFYKVGSVWHAMLKGDD